MLTEDLEFPDGALKSVDAIVTKTDGAHFLWSTVHFVLNPKAAGLRETPGILPTNAFLRLTGRSSKGKAHKNTTTEDKNLEKARPFTPREWRGIRSGSFRF
jgi:hypothetical protein